MTGYEKNILESQSLLHVKTDRESPICEELSTERCSSLYNCEDFE